MPNGPLTESFQNLPATSQAAFTATSAGGNNGKSTPGVAVLSANTSQPVEPAYAPTYPAPPVLHRSGGGAGGATDLLTVADTSNPTSATAHDTNTVGSVPSGAVGGNGKNWVDFYVTIISGASAVTGTVMPRLWNSRLATWFDASLSAISFAGTPSATTRLLLARVETHGALVYCAALTLTNGVAATNGIQIDAVAV